MRTVLVVNYIYTKNNISTMLKETSSSINFVHSYKGKNGRHTVIDI